MMQTRLLIGTLAFLIATAILGYAALQEPARMSILEETDDARMIEEGAVLYQTHCASCHGERGSAENCGEIGCQGTDLNHPDLICDLYFLDVELQKAIVSEQIRVGNPPNGMPAGSIKLGGPLNDSEIKAVAAFIINGHNNWIVNCRHLFIDPIDWPPTVTELMTEFTGDTVRGQEMYSIEYGCSACHGDPAVKDSNIVGPWLGYFRENEDDRRAGYTAADYIYESILSPSAYISPDCPLGQCAGPPSGMPDNFNTRMDEQAMVDILTYLLQTASPPSNGIEVALPEP